MAIDPVTGLEIRGIRPLREVKEIQAPIVNIPKRSPGAFIQEKGVTYSDLSFKEQNRVAAQNQSGLQQAGRSIARGVGGGILTALDATINMFDDVEAEERSALGQWIDENREWLNKNTRIYREETDSPFSFESGTAWEMIANILDSGIGFAVPGMVGGAVVGGVTKGLRYLNALRMTKKITDLVNRVGSAIISNQAESRVMATQTYQETRQRLQHLVDTGVINEKQAMEQAAEAANEMYALNRLFAVSNMLQLGSIIKGKGTIDNIIEKATVKSFLKDKFKDGISEFGEEFSQGILSSSIEDLNYQEAGGQIEKDFTKRLASYMTEDLLYESLLGFGGGIIEIGSIKETLDLFREDQSYNSEYAKLQRDLIKNLNRRVEEIGKINDEVNTYKQLLPEQDAKELVEKLQVARLAYDALNTGTYVHVQNQLDEMIQKAEKDEEKQRLSKIKTELEVHRKAFEDSTRYENQNEVYESFIQRRALDNKRQMVAKKIDRLKKELSDGTKGEKAKEAFSLYETLDSLEGDEKKSAEDTIEKTIGPEIATIKLYEEIQDKLDNLIAEKSKEYQKLISNETQSKILEERAKKKKEQDAKKAISNKIKENNAKSSAVNASSKETKSSTVDDKKTAKSSNPQSKLHEKLNKLNQQSEEFEREEAKSKKDAANTTNTNTTNTNTTNINTTNINTTNINTTNINTTNVNPTDVNNTDTNNEPKPPAGFGGATVPGEKLIDEDTTDDSSTTNTNVQQPSPSQAQSQKPTISEPKKLPIKESKEPIAHSLKELKIMGASIVYPIDSFPKNNDPKFFSEIEEVVIKVEQYEGKDALIVYTKDNVRLGSISEPDKFNALIERSVKSKESSLTAEDVEGVLAEFIRFREFLITSAKNAGDAGITFPVKHLKSSLKQASEQLTLAEYENIDWSNVQDYVYYVGSEQRILNSKGEQVLDPLDVGLENPELGRTFLAIPVKQNGKILYYNRIDLITTNQTPQTQEGLEIITAVRKTLAIAMQEYFIARRRANQASKKDKAALRDKEIAKRKNLEQILYTFFAPTGALSQIKTYEQFLDYLIGNVESEGVYYWFHGGQFYVLEVRFVNGKKEVTTLLNNQNELFSVYEQTKINGIVTTNQVALENLSANMKDKTIKQLTDFDNSDSFISVFLSKARPNVVPQSLGKKITVRTDKGQVSLDVNSFFLHTAKVNIDLSRNTERTSLEGTPIEAYHQMMIVNNKSKNQQTTAETTETTTTTDQTKAKTSTVAKRKGLPKIKRLSQQEEPSKNLLSDIISDIVSEKPSDSERFNSPVFNKEDENFEPDSDTSYVDGLDSSFIINGADPVIVERALNEILRTFTNELNELERTRDKQDRQTIKVALKTYIEKKLSEIVNDKLAAFKDPIDEQELAELDEAERQEYLVVKNDYDTTVKMLNDIDKTFNLALLYTTRWGLNITVKSDLVDRLFIDTEEDLELDEENFSEEDIVNEDLERNDENQGSEYFDDDGAAKVNFQDKMLRQLKLIFNTVIDESRTSMSYYDKLYIPSDEVFTKIMMLLADRNPWGSYDVAIAILRQEAKELPWLNQVIEKLERSELEVKIGFASLTSVHYAHHLFIQYDTSRDKGFSSQIMDASSTGLDQQILDRWRTGITNHPLVRSVTDTTFFIKITDQNRSIAENIIELFNKRNEANKIKKLAARKLKDVTSQVGNDSESEELKQALEEFEQAKNDYYDANIALFDNLNMKGLTREAIARIERIRPKIKGSRYNFENIIGNSEINTFINGIQAALKKQTGESALFDKQSILSNTADLALAKSVMFFYDKATIPSHNVNGKSIYNIEVPRYIHEIFSKLIIHESDIDEVKQLKRIELLKLYNDPAIRNASWLKDVFIVDPQGNVTINENAQLFSMQQAKISIAALKKKFSNFLAQSGFDETDDGNREFIALQFFLSSINKKTQEAWFLNPAFSDKKEATLHKTKVAFDTVDYEFVENPEADQDPIVDPNSIKIKEDVMLDLINTLLMSDLNPMILKNDPAELEKRKIVGYADLIDNRVFFGLPILNFDSSMEVSEEFLPILDKIERFKQLIFDQGSYNIVEVNGKQTVELTDESYALAAEIMQFYMDTLVNSKLEQWSELSLVYNNQAIDASKDMITKYAGVQSGVKERLIAYDYVVNYSLFLANFQQVFIGAPQTFTQHDEATGKAKIKAERYTDKIGVLNQVLSNMFKRFAGVAGPKYKQGNGEFDVLSQMRSDRQMRRIRAIFAKDEIITFGDLSYFDALNELHPGQGYDHINTTDAQEFYTLEHHIDVLFKYNKISRYDYDNIRGKMQTDAYKRGEKVFTDKDLSIISQPIKPMLYGSYGHIKANVYIKSSVVPLIPQLIKGTRFESILAKMQKVKADRIAFLSAVKQGLIEGKAVSLDDEFDQTHIVEIPQSAMGWQVDVPFKKSQEIRSGSQERILLYSGLAAIEDLNIAGKTLDEHKNQWDATYTQVYETAWQELLHDFAQLDENGIVRNNAGQIQLNHKRIYDLLLQHAIDMGFSSREIESMFPNTSDNFEAPLIFSTASRRLQNLMVSILNNRIYKNKARGESAVLVSDVLLANSNPKLTSEIVWLEGYNGERLLPQRVGDDGTVRGAQIVIPFRFKDEITGKYYKLSDFTEVVDGVRRLKPNAIAQKLLKRVGYRIPTQGHNSMASLEIVGFLPEGYGNMVITSPSLITQMGSDFDVDKLFMFSYATVLNEKGQLVEFTGNGDVFALNETDANVIEKKAIAYVNDRIKSGSDLTLHQLYVGFYKQRKRLLQNKLLDLRVEVLSQKDVFEKRISKPVAFGNLKKLAKAYNEMDKNRKKSWFFSYSSQQYQHYKYSSGRAGKAGTGSFAMDSVFLAAIESTGFKLTLPSSTALGTLPIFRLADSTGNSMDDPTVTSKNASTVFKSEVISYFLSASVDNAKENILDTLGISVKSFNIIRAMIYHGHSEDVIINFIKNPAVLKAIKQYERENSQRGSYASFESIVSKIREELFEEYKKKHNLNDEDMKAIRSYEAMMERRRLIHTTLTSQDLYNINKDEAEGTNIHYTGIIDPLLVSIQLIYDAQELFERGAHIRRVQRAYNNDSAMIKKTFYAAKARLKEIEHLKKMEYREQLKKDNINIPFDELNIADELFDDPFVVLDNPEKIKGIAIDIMRRGISLFNRYFNFNDLEQYADYIINAITLPGTFSEYTYANVLKEVATSLRALAYSDLPELYGSETVTDLRKRLLFSGTTQDDGSIKNPSLAQMFLIMREKNPEFFKNNYLLREIEPNTRSPKGMHYLIFQASARQGADDILYMSAIQQLLNDNQTVLGTFYGIDYTPRMLALEMYRYHLIKGGEEGPIQFLRYFPFDLDRAAGITDQSNRVMELIRQGKIAKRDFAREYIQNNPKLLKQIPSYKINSKKGGFDTIETNKVVTGMRVTAPEMYQRIGKTNDIQSVTPLQYFSVYDSTVPNNYQIFELEAVEFDDNNNVVLTYKRINSKGTTNFKEFNLKQMSAGNQAPSVLPYNNVMVNTKIDYTQTPNNVLTSNEFENIKNGADLIMELRQSSNDFISAAALGLTPSLLAKTKVVVVKGPGSKSIAFNSKTNTIEVGQDLFKTQTRESLHAMLLEEVIHAFTVDILNNPEDYNSEIQDAVRELHYIFNRLQADILEMPDVQEYLGMQPGKLYSKADRKKLLDDARNRIVKKIQEGKSINDTENLIYRAGSIEEFVAGLFRVENKYDMRMNKHLSQIVVDKKLASNSLFRQLLEEFKELFEHLLLAIEKILPNAVDNNAYSYALRNTYRLLDNVSVKPSKASSPEIVRKKTVSDKLNDINEKSEIAESEERAIRKQISDYIAMLLKVNNINRTKVLDEEIDSYLQAQKNLKEGYELVQVVENGKIAFKISKEETTKKLHSPVFNNLEVSLMNELRSKLKKRNGPIEIRIKTKKINNKTVYDASEVNTFVSFSTPWNKLTQEVYGQNLITLTEGNFVFINPEIANLLQKEDWFFGSPLNRPSSEKQRKSIHIENEIC